MLARATARARDICINPRRLIILRAIIVLLGYSKEGLWVSRLDLPCNHRSRFTRLDIKTDLLIVGVAKEIQRREQRNDSALENYS